MSGKSRRERNKNLQRQAAPVQPPPPPSPTALQIEQQEQEIMVRSGPIPDAEEMRRYGEIDPSLPDRIVAMAEKHASSRIEIQNLAVRAEIADRQSERNETRLGQVFGFALGMTAIVTGGVVVGTADGLTGQAIGGLITGVPLVAMVQALVLGKKAQQARPEPEPKK